MLKKGARVRVFLPDNDRTIGSQIRQFHGKETTIKKIKQYRTETTYMLNGCSSDFGNYYEFFGEWLIPLTESEDSE